MMLRYMFGQSARAKVTRIIIGIGYIVSLIKAKLFGTPVGVLATSFSAWWYLKEFTTATVWGAAELLTELYEKPELFLGSVGIVIAYLGLTTWKDQKRTELSLHAGGEIRSYFKRVYRFSMDVESYCEDYVELHDKISSGKKMEELQFELEWLGGALHKAEASRAALIDMSVEVHSLEAQFAEILLSKRFAPYRLADAISCLDSMRSSAGSLVVPHFAKDTESLYFLVKAGSREDHVRFVQMYKLGNYPAPGPRQRQLRGECVGFVPGCHLRLRNDGRQSLDRERFA